MEEEVKSICQVCKSELQRKHNYQEFFYVCPNRCGKCKRSCYGFCECSKRRFEYKECQYCDGHIPVNTDICHDCCEDCKGPCEHKCKECGVTCDTECECEIDCAFCEGKLRHYDFVNDSDYKCVTHWQGGIPQCIEPMCEDCGHRQCCDSEGPCDKPCKECGVPCDRGCGCQCSKCGEETQEGGCKCYDPNYVLQKKNHHTMSHRFANQEEIRHRIKANIWIGRYDATTDKIVYNDEIYDSLSSFALAHYKSLKSNRKTVNGWKECEYKDGDEWKSTF